MKVKINEDLKIEIKTEDEKEEIMIQLWSDSYQDDVVANMIIIYFEVDNKKK